MIDGLPEAGFEGSCFCGAVNYRVTGPARFAYLCHCTDCREINGSVFHVGVAVDDAYFAVTAGDPARFVTKADSGNTITRWHCERCASQLFSRTTADETLVSVKAGSVRGVPQSDITPSLQIFHDSRLPWVKPPRGIVTYARGMRGETPIDPEADDP